MPLLPLAPLPPVAFSVENPTLLRLSPETS